MVYAALSCCANKRSCCFFAKVNFFFSLASVVIFTWVLLSSTSILLIALATLAIARSSVFSCCSRLLRCLLVSKILDSCLAMACCTSLSLARFCFCDVSLRLLCSACEGKASRKLSINKLVEVSCARYLCDK